MNDELLAPLAPPFYAMHDTHLRVFSLSRRAPYVVANHMCPSLIITKKFWCSGGIHVSKPQRERERERGDIWMLWHKSTRKKIERALGWRSAKARKTL